MDPVIGAVVIAGLTTVGKPTVEGLGNIVGRIINPSLDTVGEGISAPLQAWAKRRSELATQTLLNAAVLVHAVRTQPNAVPGRVLWPVLEKASVEEDPDLQRRWASLLANASTQPGAVHPAFPHILSELSPHDVLILDWLFEQSPYRSDPPTGSHETVTLDRLMDVQKLNADTAINILASLGRHNLIFMPNIALDVREFYEHRFQHTSITSYGVSFVRACRPPVAPVE